MNYVFYVTYFIFHRRHCVIFRRDNLRIGFDDALMEPLKLRENSVILYSNDEVLELDGTRRDNTARRKEEDVWNQSVSCVAVRKEVGSFKVRSHILPMSDSEHDRERNVVETLSLTKKRWLAHRLGRRA